MKVKIKDLKPNPFRDIKNYPIDEEKVKSLEKSIEQTGFWDNILARKNNGKIEIAYGHHRLIALQRKFKSEYAIDIPIKELDDATMIKIMANENDESWAITPGIIDETVRVTYEYLKKNFPLEEDTSADKPRLSFKGLDLPEDTKRSVIAKQISNWLDGNWTESRVYHSLERFGLIEKGILNKEAVESMPRDTYARRFATSAKTHKIIPEKQKKVAERIIEREDFSEEAIDEAFLEEKYGDELKKPEKKVEDEFGKYMDEATQMMNSLREKLKTILSYKDIIDSQIYQKRIQEFIKSLGFLDYYIQKFKQGESNDNTKEDAGN